ncbi:aromatic ring-hydroxylating dioxygenase subunit alpha [Fischerella sp. PCC 9605]|uniref:aromatic ring-hydroxylating dioxygenase subunit alpha n=1 Tax=Fischerella sp. PCC 9605 TaxID=1173024 RepID=UPI00047D4851|nr:Rieske 2Fe-2S domain-containing protein [Fischerella sp. PCC 9605]
MKLDINLEKQEVPKNTTAEMAEVDQKFNWRNFWYPVTFIQDLPADRPYSFSLYDEAFVLFKDEHGNLACLADCCCHRAAKLSDGRVIDGKIECLYHGWQFGSDGKCLHIPQLPADAKIPAKARVPSLKVIERQGIVWVWPGEAEAADVERIPTIAALDKPEFVHLDCMVDLPYDQTYLVENFIDPAHAPISHHGSRLGDRKDAQPLDMEIIESSAQKIRGRWRRTRNPNEMWRYIDFVAPNLVHHKIEFKEQDRCVGQAFYSLPLGKGRCRLLARIYSNFFTWAIKLKPRWLEHLNQNKILEQDLPIIVGVEQQIERLGRSLKEIYLPLKTCDPLVIEYRKWLDKFGFTLPFYEGYSTIKPASVGTRTNQPMLADRFSRHTQNCSSCQRAYQVTMRLKQTLVSMAIGIAGLAIVIDSSSFSHKLMAVLAFLSTAALAGVVEKFKTHFERSYQRS